MKKTAQEPKVTENPLYHDTWMLLRKYRDVVWSLELSVQQVRRQFQIEYGSSIEEFLESLYVAGITFEGSAIEDHARCIERSYKMLKLLDTSVELLRTKHKYGESYYWLLYYHVHRHRAYHPLYRDAELGVFWGAAGNFLRHVPAGLPLRP